MTIDTTRARWVLVISALAGASAVVAVGRRALGVAVLGTVVLTHPWALQIVDRFGGGSVAWRMLLVLPLPVLFGLLVTVPLSMAARRIALPVTAIVAVLAVLVLALAGNPSVKRSGRVSIGAPSWDISPQLFAVAQRLTRLAGGHGTVAAPERIGQVVAMSTLDVHPVQVRRILGSRIEVEVGPRFRAEERALVADAMNHGASDDQAVARALRDLGVRSACVAPRVVDARLERALREAGMTKRSADDSCTYWGARDT